jgi:drug/metabolite transporter (DMT)-like permease
MVKHGAGCGLNGRPAKHKGKFVMAKLLHITLILSAVTSVAVADVLLKKATVQGSWLLALKSPWLAGAVLLYLYQILFFTHVFVTGGALSFVGSLQTVLYALIVVGAGVFVFQESLSRAQTLGIVLAVVGAILINLE